MFPQHCWRCVSPFVLKGMNHSTEARLRDGSAPVPDKPALSGVCRGNAPIPLSIPLGVTEYFPTVFARRFPPLEVEIGAGRVQVLVDGLYQVFPDIEGDFIPFPQYSLFALRLSGHGTSCICGAAT